MHTLVLLENGTVMSSGVNDLGALGRETEGPAWDTAPQRTGNQTDPYTLQPVPLPASTKVTSVSAGDNHSMATTSTGSVFGWGTFKDLSGVMGFSPDVKVQLLPATCITPRS